MFGCGLKVIPCFLSCKSFSSLLKSSLRPMTISCPPFCPQLPAPLPGLTGWVHGHPTEALGINYDNLIMCFDVLHSKKRLRNCWTLVGSFLRCFPPPSSNRITHLVESHIQMPQCLFPCDSNKRSRPALPMSHCVTVRRGGIVFPYTVFLFLKKKNLK